MDLVPRETSTSINLAELSYITEKEGQKLYHKNSNYKRIADLMEDPQVREFTQVYFSNSLDAKTVILFMRTYDHIQRAYLNTHQRELSKYETICYLHKLLSTSETLHYIVELFDQLDQTKPAAIKLVTSAPMVELLEESPELAELEKLRQRVQELEAENARLKEQLAARQ